jgi:peptide/nickel transport system substrate-binding protein
MSSMGTHRRDVLKAGLSAGALALAPWHAGNAQTAGIPREKTLILIWWPGPRGRRWIDFELWNPYSTKSNPQNGSNLIYEPLAYYSVSADKNYMWLAESYQFTPDFQQLTIRTRPEISWSDGVPFSADDVAYTLNTIRDYGPKMKWGVDIAEAMKEARTTDANTVVVDFLKPSPRFFWFLTYRYDIGVFIVPKHIFDGQDWLSFKHFDLVKGWPVSTGPWKVVDASPEQKVFERRPQWWAVKAGLAPLPHIERNVWLPFNDEQALAQAIIANQVDTGSPIQPSTLQNIFRENPKVITYSGQKPPYGYLDWWPISLYLNNEVKPFDDPAVRWALSYYIDRQQLIDLVWQGASQVSSLPMPDYPALRPYFDHVKDLLAKYDTVEFNPEKGDALLSGLGFKKGNDGIWARDGAPITLDIIGFAAFGSAMGPVLSGMLRDRGVAASSSLPSDFDERFERGAYTGAIYGHGGAIREPYGMLRLYHTRRVAVPGAHRVNFSRWKNAEFDKITDEMFITDPNDKPKMMALLHRAMEIWLPALPDIQLVQNFHRIPMNTTYWKNWPTAENPYVNGAPWHLTFPIVLWSLQQT